MSLASCSIERDSKTVPENASQMQSCAAARVSNMIVCSQSPILSPTQASHWTNQLARHDIACRSSQSGNKESLLLAKQTICLHQNQVLCVVLVARFFPPPRKCQISRAQCGRVVFVWRATRFCRRSRERAQRSAAGVGGIARKGPPLRAFFAPRAPIVRRTEAARHSRHSLSIRFSDTLRFNHIG